jgi:uncharacterized repeat protein (TIGR01451 family)
MKKVLKLSLLTLVGLLLGVFASVKAQTSVHTVKYKITYESSNQTYTAWVIPDYNVPNALPDTNNLGTTEKGSTAQFTIVVPKDFVITQITDIKGTWAKPTDSGFIKLGPGNPNQTWPGLDPTLNYYVVGKTPSETDYGTFTTGTPVALFSFKGNGCFGPVKPLPPGDPFIAAADNNFSLNVANSFYSRSGQPRGGNVVPREQFVNITGPAAECSVPTGTADLRIIKTLVGAKTRALNDIVTYKVVVKNLGPATATNVVVKDSVSTGLELTGGSATTGTFTSPQWSIPSIASGDSAELTVTAKIIAEGISFNYALIKSADQPDPTKNNNTSEVCVSAVYKLCVGNALQVSVSSSYTNVVWFKNNVQVGTGNSILLSEIGTYTYTATNVTCPASGCCPIVIESDSNCCPVTLCVPATVRKIKK